MTTIFNRLTIFFTDKGIDRGYKYFKRIENR